jgi:hypothetical protein
MGKKKSQLKGNSRDSAYASTANPTTQATNTTGTKSSSPYDRDFQQNLIDHGVYPKGYKYPDGQLPPYPGNMKEMNGRLS